MRWILCTLCLLGCDSELSYGKLRAPDAGPDAPTCVALPSFELGDGDPSCPSAGFHHALCSCRDYVSGGSTLVDGYSGAYSAGQAEGSLALGGGLSAGNLRIAGALIVAGTTGAPLTGELTAGSLFSAGPVQGNQTVSVGGDARINGDVRLDSMRVGGTLTLPTGAALELDDGQLPNLVRAPVSIVAPCSCDNPLDVGSQIDLSRVLNDNAQIDLEPLRGLRSFDAPITRELPCGRYFVTQIYAAQPITLRVRGDVALYVDERIVSEQAGSVTIEVDDGAELALFIRGGITGGGPIRIGTDRSASRTRIYVGGDDSLFFAAPASIAGTLYAPNSELVTQSRFELFGASLLRRFVAEQETLLHHESTLASACVR